jgi:hypothetical protein
MVILSIADTFIKRPVLSTVCTLLILLVGGISIPLLPINNLPDIAPIQIVTSGTYIGADAQTVEETVTTPVERQINGVEKMEYISSTRHEFYLDVFCDWNRSQRQPGQCAKSECDRPADVTRCRETDGRHHAFAIDEHPTGVWIL